MKLIWILLLTSLPAWAGEPVALQAAAGNAPRAAYGIGKLSIALKEAGYTISRSGKTVIRVIQQGNFGKEGFSISSKNETITIAGTDASGVLYGCLELADRIREHGRIPSSIHFSVQARNGAARRLRRSAETLLPARKNGVRVSIYARNLSLVL